MIPFLYTDNHSVCSKDCGLFEVIDLVAILAVVVSYLIKGS